MKTKHNGIIYDNEIRLLSYFELSHLVEFIGICELYKMAGEKAFLEKMDGPEVESVRRCLIALSKGTCYRGTQEWDDMIQFEAS